MTEALYLHLPKRGVSHASCDYLEARVGTLKKGEKKKRKKKKRKKGGGGGGGEDRLGVGGGWGGGIPIVHQLHSHMRTNPCQSLSLL